jgi:small subunit ribosomal protein S3
MRADIDYGFTEAATTMGRIGVKVWVYKGDVLPEAEVVSEMLTTETSMETTQGTPRNVTKQPKVTESEG